MAVLIISLWHVSKWQAPLEYHIDEAYWVGSAYYYHLLTQNTGHSDWQLLPARENPPIGKYVIGLWMDLFGSRIRTPNLLGSFYLRFDSGRRGWWGGGFHFEKRKAIADRVKPSIAQAARATGRLPLYEADLRSVRWLSILCGMICALLIGVFGSQTGRLSYGLLAGLGFACHPIAIDAYEHAMIDMIALMFSCAAMALFLTVWQILRKHDSNSKQVIASSLGLGVLLACACGSKMNALIVVSTISAAVLYLVTRWLRRDEKRFASQGMRLASIGFVFGFAVFFASNPTLWAAPLDGLIALVREHSFSMQLMQAVIPGGLHSVSSRLQAVGDVLLGSAWLLVPFFLSVGGHAWYYLKRKPDGHSDRYWLIILWFCIGFILLLAWLPFGWSRYILPLLPPALILVSRVVVDGAYAAYTRWAAAGA